MNARKTFEEIQAAAANKCPVAWMQLREIKRAGSFEAWEAADIARIEKNRPHAKAWARDTASAVAAKFQKV